MQSLFTKKLIGSATGVFILLVITAAARADTHALAPPPDPAQSITYWKPHVIAAETDPTVAGAHAVFSVLLRAWDQARLEPSLYVVNAASASWAASLADGSILLTRSALDTIMDFGQARGAHLLAFVLAHELAHQRADDLWHQRFFRLIGSQDPEMRKQIAKGLPLKEEMLADMEEKEAQADHDGLLMMASVGYDPYQILDEKDFFTAWIENIWQAICPSEGENGAIADACIEAHNRALRARAQLAAIATQTTLYTMGVQAFVAGRYQNARHYFSVYGRSYTNRAVLTAIGLTHFSEALLIQQRLPVQGPAFYYPVLLDANPLTAVDTSEDLTAKRSDAEADLARNRRLLQANLERAITLFEKAIRLEPHHPKTYLMLAYSYLLGGNTFMAKGIVQGKYIPKFGSDTASTLILAMTTALEGDHQQAQVAFEKVIADLQTAPVVPTFPKDLLTYAAFHNSAVLAEYLGQTAEAERLWQALARQAKTAGNSLIFRLSLNQLKIDSPRTHLLADAPTIAGVRIGDRFASITEDAKAYQSDALWIEGQPFRVLRNTSGSRFVVGPDEGVVGAWQDSGQNNPGDVTFAGRVAIGDGANRPMKAMGIPDRCVHMLAGEYWAYDAYGVAMHIQNNRVAGWFLYSAE